MKKPNKRPKTIDAKHFGGEPTSASTSLEVTHALNWYNYFHDVKSGKKWLVEYAKKNKLGSVDNCKEVNITMCAIARMLNQGIKFPNNDLKNWLHKKIKEKKPKLKLVVNRAIKVNFPLTKFEDQVDKFYSGEYKYFDPEVYSILRELNARPIDAKSIVEYYTPLLEELSDPEAKEGYSRLTRKQLSDYKKFIGKIVEDAQNFLGNLKVSKVRKPRKKKVKAASQIASKVKYKANDDELQISSAAPETMVDSSVIYLYNTKYKKLVKLVAPADSKMTVKGTTVIGFDPALSEQKTVRKPKELLGLLVKASKAGANKLFKELTTKPSAPNGRVNSETVILKTVK